MVIARKRAPRRAQLLAAGPLTISAYEAKAQFSRLLDRVVHGEEIVIARNGEPIARLVPVVRNRIAEILGRDQGKIDVPDDFNDPMDWTMKNAANV